MSDMLAAMYNAVRVFNEEKSGCEARSEASLTQLQEKISELLRTPDDLKKYAQATILLLDSLRRSGYDANDLTWAFRQEMGVNRLGDDGGIWLR